jgi:choline dehydrogenase-like flavoprotein
MIIDDQYYDVIIIGTGAGGGTLAHKLAPTGKKILILERGEFQAKESSELIGVEVFKKEQYHAPEQWYDNAGEPFSPQTNYGVGGNTKIYSGALLRLRERDFEEVEHQEGISPAWPLRYQDFEPYYSEAEQLYQVHGKTGDDPTEPPHSQDYPQPALTHEPQIQAVCEALTEQGLHPTTLPIGLGQQGRTDAEDTGVTPAVNSYTNVTLKTGARAVRLHTNPSGTVVKAVQAEVGEQEYLFLGDIIVLSCGAINSAVLLLQSANEKHPKGLANNSEFVGRNLMKQSMSVLVQLSSTANSGLFQRTVYVNDFYWGDKDFPYPMGHIQNSGGILQDVIFSEAPPIFSVLTKMMPGFGLRQLATRSVGWWMQTEDLPNPSNRVHLENHKINIHYQQNNVEAHDRLVYRWIDALKTVEAADHSGFNRGVHPRSNMPVEVVAHQCGTCRFGEDPATSVLDLNCRAHGIDNLYVVDSSFFPSSSSTSPGLTVIANALRVGAHLIERLK